MNNTSNGQILDTHIIHIYHTTVQSICTYGTIFILHFLIIMVGVYVLYIIINSILEYVQFTNKLTAVCCDKNKNLDSGIQTIIITLGFWGICKQTKHLQFLIFLYTVKACSLVNFLLWIIRSKYKVCTSVYRLNFSTLDAPVRI